MMVTNFVQVLEQIKVMVEPKVQNINDVLFRKAPCTKINSGNVDELNLPYSYLSPPPPSSTFPYPLPNFQVWDVISSAASSDVGTKVDTPSLPPPSNAFPMAPALGSSALPVRHDETSDSASLAGDKACDAEEEECASASNSPKSSHNSLDALAQSQVPQVSHPEEAEVIPLKFTQPKSQWWELSAEEEELSVQELWGLPLAEDTYVIQKLGEGGFGAVYLVARWIEELGAYEEVAMKVMKAKSDLVKSWHAERDASLKLQDLQDRVALVRESARTADALFLFYDYYEEGTLGDIEYSLNTTAVFKIFQELCKTIELIHERGIVHADLKPANILVKRDEHGEYFPVVADFGLSFDVEVCGGKVGFRGTRGFTAPEILESETTEVRWGAPADIYALGVTLYYLARRFGGEAEKRLDLSTILTLASGCLLDEPAARFTATDLVGEFEWRDLYVEETRGKLSDEVWVFDRWQEGGDVF